MKTTLAIGLVVFLAAVPVAVLGQGPPPQAIAFAVIGDLGYFPEEEPWVENLFLDLNRTMSLAFVVHVGDLSSPRYACTDEMLARRLGQFRASAHPLIFTPGDNDWTDCHEPTIKGGNPLERLAKVRTLFFDGDRTLGQRTFPLSRQSADPAFARYRENVRWEQAGVTFFTLHVTGSNNGLGRASDGDAEYAERNNANLTWLRQGFEHAKTSGSRAVMILQQANIFPAFPPFPGSVKDADTTGFVDLRSELQKEARALGKPVVLVHGDSHFFRIDKPLSPQRARGATITPSHENFTRVEGFGTPYHHWLHVTVEPNEPGVFTFRQRIVPGNLGPAKP